VPGIIGHYPFTWRNFKLILNLLTRFSGILTEYRRIWQTLGETGRSLPARCAFIVGHLMMRFRRKSVFSGACDMMAVSGDFNKELAARQGFPPDRIVVTGLPRLDSIASLNSDKDEFIKQIEQMRGNTKVVLYLPSLAAEHKMMSYSVQMETTRQVISSIRDMRGVRLLIKPHPGESPDSYRSLVDELASNALVYGGSNLHDLIRASDVVITGISGTGLETLALNKTLVIINLREGGGYFPPGYEYIPYVGSGVAFSASYLEELPSVIKAAIFDQEEIRKRRARSPEFVYHHLYKLDGQASKRVADLILEMVAASKNKPPSCDDRAMAGRS
jgi:CDP-glycerol glycerophosphotransferase (TagB/SpsB family)